MADKNLRHQNVAIAAVQNTGTWSSITPDGETAKMHVRATGSFQLASSSSPGNDIMTFPSGVGYDYESGGNLYARMYPKAGVIQTLKYS